MSLKVLLRCSDEEFERLISLMDLESVLDIISELQTEMDKEQERFDSLSLQLSSVTDQASAEFRKLSAELLKSQNMLALLIGRNMHCFNVSNEPEEDAQLGSVESPLVTYTKGRQPNTPQTDNNSHMSTPAPSTSTPATRTVKPLSHKKSILQIVTAVNKKAAAASPSYQNGLVGAIKTTVVAKNEAVNTTDIKPAQQSMATLTVISPRKPSQEVKPKRVLKVRTASLSSDNFVSGLKTYHSSNGEHRRHSSDLGNPAVAVMTHEVGSTLQTTEEVTSTLYSVSSRTPSTKPVNSTYTSSITLPISSPRSDFCAPHDNSTFPAVSDIALSPRSDISNLATPRSLSGTPRSISSTPRSFSSSPRLPVSSILELDIPETSIDGSSHWKDSVCNHSGGVETVSDKISCTTDESGFTSGSSDSDIALPAPDIVYDYHFEVEEKVEERVFMKSWNPSKLLGELYKIELAKEQSSNPTDLTNMEGYLERLPIGKNKNTLLKTWKRTYCRAVDGVMYFYNRKDSKEAQSYMSLMGGLLEELSNRMIGIDDMRGHYMMVRCPSDVDHLNWKRSFYTQIKCSPQTSYVRPCLTSNPSSNIPKVIIIDLGSTSVRAGILGSTPSYPLLFFPSISSTNEERQTVFGVDAYIPKNRNNGLHRPIAACKEIDTYRINVQALPELFTKIFTDLKVDVQQYMVLLSTPHNFSLRLKEEVLNILLNQHGAAGVNMVNQSLLIPYIYNATSGIVVDIGERMEIVAITDGYLVDGGLSRQSFGGVQITDTLNTYLVEYRLFSPVEHLIARLIKEKTCFMSQDYGADLLKYMCNDSDCEAVVDLGRFDLPAGFHIRHIAVDTARFKAAEGLIKTEMFGVDSPTLPKLIAQVVQKCPMDVRREMWQSIYLSGGTTVTPSFAERLQKELGKIVPSSINIQVHASPHRYHAAYIGACMLAKLPTFLDSCITRAEWQQSGSMSLSKWKRYFQG